ncbi:hypothetical protein [Pseudomonas nitroreducens]|uniref:Uncharacterized protein n=1 Tax=Pseudomonas nitroreducens TaxID=46680 RepID=A0A6G6J2K5_PSENT|nr:hypothetical protein [Pseudomonas nitroreducens]QIE89474.1 hypothetical protein G5B91_25700 [Pseudomonas nitroreducens]
MARSRNIKPSFFKNEDLADLPPFDRLLFIGLWCLADREGRLEDRPRRIKIELFPGDTYDVEIGLGNLEGKGFIERYEVFGFSVISLPKFTRHQSPHSTEKDSELPDCNGYLTVNERQRGKVLPGKQRYVHAETGFTLEANNGEVTVKAQEQPEPPTVDAPTHNALIPDSLIPDSLIPDYLNPEEEQKPLGASAEAPASDQGGQQAGKPAKYSDDFESFWREYPKRDRSASKPDAWKAWGARLKEGVSPQDLIRAAANYRTDQFAKGKVGTEFVKLPATFLGKGEHWKPYSGPQPEAQAAAQQSAVLSVPTHSQEMYPDDKF